MKHFKQWAAGNGQSAVGSRQSAVNLKSQISNLKSQIPAPSAFTLVELLVVVVIISMLAGLLLPALIGARGRARIAQCTNHQGELGKAIHQYEIAKNRLPGYANHITTAGTDTTATGYTVGWVPVLFPYMGRMDLWEGTSGTDSWRRSIALNATYLLNPPSMSLLLCPDDDTPDGSTLS
jgi:prepilin-type N-terminal cleavage/methylation domain-containing protein